MNVPAPMFISSRLMAALKLPDGSTAHVSYLGRTYEGRQHYEWAIDDADGKQLGTDNDLHSGVGSPADYREAMESLLAFLGAAAESTDGGENADLFPIAVVEWARENSDEIGSLAYELEEGTNDDV